MSIPTPSPLLRAQSAVAALTAVTLVASALAGSDSSHRHAAAAPATAVPAPAATPATAMPTIEIRFKLTASESAISADSATTIGVADSNIWNLDAAGVDQNLDALQSIGVTSVRLPVPWMHIETQSGTYDWSQMDTIVSAAQARGMSIVGTITGNPSWDGTVAIGQPDAQAYASFAAAVASRYSSQISAFEIWNEENSQGFFSGSNSAAAYTAVLKAAYTAIKAVDPSATVVVGGLAAVATISGLEQSPQKFLNAILANGAAGYFDAIAYHPYNLGTQLSEGAGLAESPLNQLNALRAALNAYGLNDTQIWATEYGEPTTPGTASPDQQASYIANFIVTWQALSKTLNLGPAYLYTTRDTASGALSDEANYGLFYTDGTPKPAALIVAQLEYALQNNLPLPSLESTISTLTPGQRVAFVLSEVLQWTKLGFTTASGFAKYLAGAALSTFEALPPVNAALGAIGALLNAVGAVRPMKTAVGAVASVLNALTAFRDRLVAAATTATFNTIIKTVDTMVGVGTTVAAAMSGKQATSATAVAASAVDSGSAKAAAGSTHTSTTTAEPDATTTAPGSMTTAASDSAPAATAVKAAQSDTDATTAAASDSSDTDATASSDNTKTAKHAARHKKTKSSAAAATATTAHATTTTHKVGKHRRDDGQRGASTNGPGRHRK